MKKILVVDDSDTLRKEVSRALETAGFEVMQAANGSQALAQLKITDFSLILLDVNMPGLSGLDVLDRLGADGTTEKTPVLMLTTEAHESMVLRAKDAGAKGWVIKPVRMEILLSAVRHLAT
jgi:two-component system chemotaxis response regulator CheY